MSLSETMLFILSLCLAHSFCYWKLEDIGRTCFHYQHFTSYVCMYIFI